ncbi:winged helix-turn-helix transcriptional regulator [Corynebacterium freiburgense]|nr:HTH-type transcriptional activator HxlR [Corynebacterium freiburgense]
MIVTIAEAKLRFGDSKTRFEGISGKVRTDTLRALERGGIVPREKYAEIPPRVMYELTPLGKTLLVPLAALTEWAEIYTCEVMLERQKYDELQEGL